MTLAQLFALINVEERQRKQKEHIEKGGLPHPSQRKWISGRDLAGMNRGS